MVKQPAAMPYRYLRGATIVLCVLLLSGIHCSSRKPDSQPAASDGAPLRTLGYRTSYPFPLMDPDATLVDDTILIHYYKGIVLYDMPSRYVKNDVVISSRMYFMYREGDSEGVKIDTLTDQPIDPMKKMPKGAYLKQVAHGNEQLAATDSLVNLVTLNDATTRCYIMKRQPPEGMLFDTIKLRYNEALSSFSYSLAPQFDTVAGKKLSVIEIPFHVTAYLPPSAKLGRFRQIRHELFIPIISEPSKQRLIIFLDRQHGILQ